MLLSLLPNLTILTKLIIWEDFIAFLSQQNFKSYKYGVCREELQRRKYYSETMKKKKKKKRNIHCLHTVRKYLHLHISKLWNALCLSYGHYCGRYQPIMVQMFWNRKWSASFPHMIQNYKRNTESLQQLNKSGKCTIIKYTYLPNAFTNMYFSVILIYIYCRYKSISFFCLFQVVLYPYGRNEC